MCKAILRCGFILISLVLSPLYLFAQVGLPLIEHFMLSDFDWTDQSWSLFQDSIGQIYIGSTNHIVVHNGRWGDLYDYPYANTCRDIKYGPDKQIYAACSDGIYRLKADSTGKIFHERIKSPMLDSLGTIGDVWDLESVDNHLFALTNNYLIAYNPISDSVAIYKSKGRFFKMFKVGEKIYLNSIPGGLMTFDNGELKNAIETNDNFSKRIFPIGGKEWGNNRMILVDFYGSIIHYKSGKTDNIINSIKEKQIAVYNVFLNDTLIFMATNKGLIISDYFGNVRTHMTKDSGLSSPIIYDVMEDREGLLWLATEKGVNKIERNGPFRVLKNENEITGFINHLLVVNDSHILVSTNGGLFKIEKKSGEITKMTVFGAPEEAIRSLYTFKMDGIIYNVNRNYMAKVDVSKNLIYNQHERFGEPVNFAILLDRFLFVVKHTALVQYEIEPGELKFIKEYSVPFSITGLSNDGKRLWIRGSDKSVYLKTDTDGNYIIGEQELDSDIYGAVSTSIETKNQFIYGTHTGLYRIDKENRDEVHAIKSEKLNKDYIVFRMSIDIDKDIWIRGSGAHFIYRIGDLKESKSEIIIDAFRRLKVRATNTFDFKDYPIVWMAGEDHIVRVDKNRLISTEFEPVTIINKMAINRDSVIYFGSGDVDLKSYELPYEHNSVRFEFSLTAFKKPDDNRYRTRLLGMEDNWTTYSSEYRRDFTGLFEGNYTFQAQGISTDGILGKIANFDFVILPPWYRTWWAYSIWIILVAGFLYLIYLFRINQIKRIYNVRNQIAQDLHDEISSTISSISFFAEAMNRVLPQQSEDQRKYLSLIKSGSDDAKEKVSDVIWSINPVNDKLSDIEMKFRRFVSQISEAKGIKHEFISNINSDNRLLNPKVRHNLWLCLKEIITNTVRHSDADHVMINIEILGNLLKISIKDNGKGFDYDRAISSGNGLKNIKNRIEAIGGIANITTGPNGTQWDLEIIL